MEHGVKSKVNCAVNASTSPAPGVGDASEPIVVDEPDIENQCIRRGRKRTSMAWDFFDEPVVKDGELLAQCKRCKKYLTAKGKGGTSHLLDHGRYRCPNRDLKKLKGQQTIRFDTTKDGESDLIIESKFNQEYSRTKLVDMIVLHEYPLSMVDHVSFRQFVSSLNSKFKMISRNTLRSDILKAFTSQKQALKKFLENHSSRVALTTDMWTASNQKKGYMAITAHFIDNDWILRNRTLRFCYVPCPHTKDVLAVVMMDCIYKYGLENKVSSVVLDNCATNIAMMDIIKGKFEASSLILGGDFLHMRCCAHILNLIVKTGLDAISSEIITIRDNISFWVGTPKRLEMFEHALRTSKVSSAKRLILDCQTRWNSTYLMLETAIPYKDVFPKVARMNSQLNITPPSEKQWELARKVCEKLKVFYRVTELFSGKHYPTSNLYFAEICEIKIQLKSWLVSDVPIIEKMAVKMIEKFDKYWLSVNGLMAVATILDPSSKMDCVELYFDLIYKERSKAEQGRVRKLLEALMLEYKDKANASVSGISDAFESQPLHGGVPFSSRGSNIFSIHKQKTKKRKVNVSAELDRYLEDEVLPDDVDVLGFWKNNFQYPTIREIAKDLLAIPVSSVASESAFSTGGRVLTPHRSRLHSKTVEALMCLQNWMIGGCPDSHIQHSFAYASVLEDADNNSYTSGVVDEYEGKDVYMTCDF